MTRFHKDQCPKLAVFIVRHIRLVLEHPDVVNAPSCRMMYLQLLEQWQYIAATVLEQGRHLETDGKNTH
ncbi:hypothetical protein [Methyloglobulus sp.]|uniref:hypothetical protein n=1 Tax=Methyloglobulus sp. TaxID=2518622 RepID=UPI00398924D1